MTLINKTIYPQYDKPISKAHLEEYFTPTREEVKLATTHTRGKINICAFLVNLKILQNFNYFIPSKDIPSKIIKHIKSKLEINQDIDIVFSDRSVRRQRNEIRAYLNKEFDTAFIKELTYKSVIEYEPIMENSADVFNAVLERLIKNNCELPAFSTIERWIKSKQTEINNDLFRYVSDRYIALFSHFIPCGVWEAVYIIDGLLKNKSDIQPDTIHADTQGQSATVFALTHLLGIKLMPRIRNWKDLKFYKPYKESSYNHIDSLFKDSVKWDIIETHYEDLFQIILSIKSGKILPSTLLRKLNNYSKKNKLFQAFRELGNVIRTMYLLDFISDIKLREKITESTNKTESYNAFSKWFFFGGEGVIRENSIDEQTKVIKYNELLANAVILQNTIDMGNTIKRLKDDGVEVSKQDIKNLSPYLTSHIKRFGEYIIDLEGKSEPIVNLDLDKILQ